jgi:hypothetical protein
MQHPLPAPSATGAFIKTPFAHLLVYALERRLSGTFELLRGAAVTASMLVVGGYPAKVRTEEGIHYLGDVMAELGMINPHQLAASLEQMRAAPRLHGQILLEMGAVDPPRLDAALRAQTERKVEHLFSLPTETTFRYYDNVDLLSGFGGAPSAIDPFPVIWRGVREKPAREHVDATLRRIGNALLRLSASSQLERFAFSGPEVHAVELLKQRPARLTDVVDIVGPGVGQLLVYLLMIMKQVDLVDPSQAQAQAPSPGAPAPAAPPSAPSAVSVQSPSTAGQAFARVQLTRQSPRNPLVVEEVVASSNPNDDRASSPVKAAAPVSAPGAFHANTPPTGGAFGTSAVAAAAGAMDIGAMITTTIQQSSAPPSGGAASVAPAIPPPPNAANVPSVPPADGAVAPSAPPPAVLTAEQTTLKTKILERADQITSQDYFQMLGVDRDATAEQIQKAFFGLAKVWHPDRLPPALIDVKDACSKVFTHLTEAHATLTDAPRRQDYMTLLRDGGATPDDQAKIQAILEAATEFQKAEILLKRNTNDTQAYEIVKRCVSLDGDQADYLATLAWLDAQKAEWMSREKTLEKCLILERCIQRNPNCERAYFYRGMLYKRAGEASKALKDFKKAADLNPRNLDAMREVRLHNMRGGASKPPPGPTSGGPGSGSSGGPGARGSKGNKPAESESLGGLLGKLFKK